MNRYRVIALAVNGKRKMFRSGDEVVEDNFPFGHADILVAKGFLEKIGEDEQKPEDQSGQPEFVPKQKFDINYVTSAQMKADLKLSNVEYPKNASKTELFEIWKHTRG